ncbi:hypothetical protein [Flavobacterium daemonense]|uniref:hypothetical protein n=1 Tax=Flavobacterium daemonense TaxID=1393049 RepID=UPI00118579A3|nr:hypothetical protein [Flavobacterium daemonense]KAF2336489.1 hypothetical protein FND99_04195 [Flavobacterium daemonense]
MKNLFKTVAIALVFLNSQYFIAQQINKTQAQIEVEFQKAVLETKRISAENHKKLDDQISDLNRQQKEIEKQKKEIESRRKNLSKSENNLNSTKDKITKLEHENQKIENKITITSISEEEIAKQRLKVKENEVSIQKLKLTQITQEKDLEKVLSAL